MRIFHGAVLARLPPLNALKCFEATARCNSFSRAADELHVTQSAVSHQIRQLEEWFGVALFDRQGRQTLPTPEGVELAALRSQMPLALSGLPASALPRAMVRRRSPLPPFPLLQQSGSYRACPLSCASTRKSMSA
jgi:LysR family glycine cleavage system transcriptional activator